MNPTVKAGIPVFSPDSIFGISSRTTTYSIAPAAKARKYGKSPAIAPERKKVSTAKTGSTAPESTPNQNAFARDIPAAQNGSETIAPSGKFETFRRQGGKYEDYPVKGITVRSKLDKNLWQAEVSLPLDALPVRKIAAGNFIRGIPDSGIAWCPTFEKSYGIPAVFGNLILEK